MAETRLIQKQLAGVEDLLLGIGTATQTRATGPKTITKINADQLQGALVVDTIDELLALNPTLLVTGTCIVKDESRGGVFVYDASKSAINNGGTIFNGWARQYDGAVNVKWFGAVSGEDNTASIQAALNTGMDVCLDVAHSDLSASLVIGSQKLFSSVDFGINRTQAVFNIDGNFPAIINISGSYISFDIEGIYFNYGETAPTNAEANSNKIAIYISGSQSGEYYHISNCTIRGAWIGYKDTTGSYLSKLTQVACRHTRQGFWKNGGTTISFDTCSSSDGINGFIVENVLSTTLLNCAADGLIIDSNSYGITGNYFRYVYGLNISGWDGESNSISNIETSLNNNIIPSYMRFHNTVGSISGLCGHSNYLNSTLANSGVTFFFVSDNSLVNFKSCDLHKEGFTNDLVFSGSLCPVYSLVGVNSSITSIHSCDFRAPTGGTPTTRYSIAGLLSATISSIGSIIDNNTLALTHYTSGGTFYAPIMGFSSFPVGSSFGTTTSIGNGQQYGAFGSEIATFQKNGNVALFSTTSSADSGNCIETARGTNGTAIAMFNNGVRVGHIDVTGSATSYVTSSDYRLKENIKDMEGFIDRIKALKPVHFTWKVDGRETDGFIAHELQEVIPEAVTGEKDKINENGEPDYQGIDQSKIVPLLTRTIQDLLYRVELLESK